MSSWMWFIGKNLLGWLLILGSMVLGPFVPGPGGIPLFLIGFGLITFPGKRRITARVLSGRPVDPETPTFRRGVAAFALVAPAVALTYLLVEDFVPRAASTRQAVAYVGGYLVSAVVFWWVVLHSHRLLNVFLGWIPRMRRRMRPWLRRHGIDLLPPRRRRRPVAAAAGGTTTRDPDPEILEIRDSFRRRMGNGWRTAKPWLRRIATVGVTVLIFVWMFKPVARNWADVRERIWAISWADFLLASAMFAAFLFVFRVNSWRWIIQGFGYRLPLRPATRIWSTSELARYLPGVIWQVVGRVYLCKPYGVRGSACTASQVLELAIFLLANILMAVGCLVWLGIKSFEGPAQTWLYVALALVPVLVFLLHPKILYGTINSVMRRLGKPPVNDQMGFRALGGLLLWAAVGLLWQSLAIWLLVREPLGLPLAKWWVVAGAYSLAWCAGFLMVLSPGGLGTRELVFMAAMSFALPNMTSTAPSGEVSKLLNLDPAARAVLLAFLSVLLRLWTIAGELMLSSIAYALDFRGALRTKPTVRTPDAQMNPSLEAAAADELETTGAGSPR